MNEKWFWEEATSLPVYGLAGPLTDPKAAFQLTVTPVFCVVLLAAALAASVVLLLPVTVYGLFCLAFQPVRLAWLFFVRPFEGAGELD